MDKQSASRIIGSLGVIQHPGKKALKVISNPTFVEGEGDQPDRYLINFKATTPNKMEKARELGKEGNYQDATNVATLSFGQVVGYNGETPWLPKKGETVDAEVEEVPDRDDNMVLRVTSINEREAEQIQSSGEFSFDDEGEEESEEATEGEEFSEEGSS